MTHDPNQGVYRLQSVAAVRNNPGRPTIPDAPAQLLSAEKISSWLRRHQGPSAAPSRGVPTVLVQEGGYLLEKLGENAVAFLQAFV